MGFVKIGRSTVWRDEGFKEGDHPRAKDGKFGSGVGSNSESVKANSTKPGESGFERAKAKATDPKLAKQAEKLGEQARAKRAESEAAENFAKGQQGEEAKEASHGYEKGHKVTLGHESGTVEKVQGNTLWVRTREGDPLQNWHASKVKKAERHPDSSRGPFGH
jgi:hypothetical protein